MSVLVRAALGGELRHLIRRRLFLVFGLPLVIRHAVDDFARLSLVELHALRGRRVLVPVAQAVPTEAGKVHQIEILHVSALAEMLDEPAKGGGFELGAGAIVHGGLSEKAFSYQRESYQLSAISIQLRI